MIWRKFSLWGRRRGSSRSGQALVEFALVAGLLLMLLTGVIGYGLYINALDTVQFAAGQAAGVAALGAALGCPGDSAQQQSAAGQPPTIYGVVDDDINNGFIMSDKASNSPLVYRALVTQISEIPDQSDSSLNVVSVTVTYKLNLVLPTPGLPNPVILTKTANEVADTTVSSNSWSTASCTTQSAAQ